MELFRVLVVLAALLLIAGGVLRGLDEDGGSNAPFWLLVAALVLFMVGSFLGRKSRTRR